MAEETNPAVPPINPWLIVISVMFGTFMEVLDTTVVNVSLPHIAGNLSATPEEATWALTSYLVANAIILPITGWLANYFGRKRLLMTAVVGFTTASFFCGFAPTLAWLVIFRIIQGLTGGVLQPLSQAVMLEAFPPAQQGKAMGIWGLGIVVAPMLGPVLGGWLTDNYSWRWIFYVNIPVGLVSIIMTKMYIFDPPYIRRSGTKVDKWGIGMLAVGIGTLQLVLDKGQQEDWFSSTWITSLLILSMMMLVLFIVHEFRTADPVLHLKVFKNRTYSTGVFLMTTLGFVLYGSLVLLPLFLQTVLGYPAMAAGIAMAPRGLGSFIAMPVVGFLIAKFDPRKLLGFGLIGGAISLFALGSINLQVGYWDIFWPQFFQGISMGLIFVPLTTVTMSLIKKEEMGNATSLFNLMRNLGGSVGIAVIATMLSRTTQIQFNVLGAHVSAFDANVRLLLDQIRGSFIARGLDFTTASSAAYVALSGMVQKQAVMVAFVNLFRILALVFAVVVPLVFLMKKPRHTQPSGPMH
ncbi:MAG TPA: DHA2 family efflux MFS transporter permease subunit [Terriglobia bacterium]|nr:DHA2 family efflux MFS transporter permease subunit [Terriglobia bacterium]